MSYIEAKCMTISKRKNEATESYCFKVATLFTNWYNVNSVCPVIDQERKQPRIYREAELCGVRGEGHAPSRAREWVLTHLSQWFSKCAPSVPENPETLPGGPRGPPFCNNVSTWGWNFFIYFKQSNISQWMECRSWNEKPASSIKLDVKEIKKNVKQSHSLH